MLAGPAGEVQVGCRPMLRTMALNGGDPPAPNRGWQLPGEGWRPKEDRALEGGRVAAGCWLTEYLGHGTYVLLILSRVAGAVCFLLTFAGVYLTQLAAHIPRIPRARVDSRGGLSARRPVLAFSLGSPPRKALP